MWRHAASSLRAMGNQRSMLIHRHGAETHADLRKPASIGCRRTVRSHEDFGAWIERQTLRDLVLQDGPVLAEDELLVTAYRDGLNLVLEITGQNMRDATLLRDRLQEQRDHVIALLFHRICFVERDDIRAHDRI